MLTIRKRLSRPPAAGGVKILNLLSALLPLRETGEGLALILVLLFFGTEAHAAPRATVTVYPTATVAAPDITLGDIASIQCSDKTLSARLTAAVMGRAPMPGVTRPLTGGDVRLKLRQDGIDPSAIAFAGSDSITVASVAANSPETVPAAAPNSLTTAKPAGVLVHAGDGVNLVYESDGVVITARVTAVTSGGAGDHISIHRDGAGRALSGTVIDAQTIRLEE